MTLLLCPSRGRPAQAQELLESFHNTRHTDLIRLAFCVDDDDATKGDYPGEVILGPPTGDPTGPLNRAALAADEDVGFIGDDSRFETQGWDTAVLRSLQTPSFVWTQDGHDKPWPSTVFVSRQIVKELGYLALPTLRRGYFDAVWVWLGTTTGTAKQLPRVMIRHLNPPTAPGAATADVIEQDRLAFERWFAGPRQEDAKKVMRAYLSYF